MNSALDLPDMDETDDGEAEETAPLAFDRKRWAQIPQDLQDEALERSGWFVFRGVAPSQALDNALKGMSDDLATLEIEPSWHVVRAVGSKWPWIRRFPSGNYNPDVLQYAEIIERLARAELVDPGCTAGSRKFPPEQPREGFNDDLEVILTERLAALRAEVAEALEDGSQEKSETED